MPTVFEKYFPQAVNGRLCNCSCGSRCSTANFTMCLNVIKTACLLANSARFPRHEHQLCPGWQHTVSSKLVGSACISLQSQFPISVKTWSLFVSRIIIIFLFYFCILFQLIIFLFNECALPLRHIKDNRWCRKLFNHLKTKITTFSLWTVL